MKSWPWSGHVHRCKAFAYIRCLFDLSFALVRLHLLAFQPNARREVYRRRRRRHYIEWFIFFIFLRKSLCVFLLLFCQLCGRAHIWSFAYVYDARRESSTIKDFASFLQLLYFLFLRQSSSFIVILWGRGGNEKGTCFFGTRLVFPKISVTRLSCWDFPSELNPLIRSLNFLNLCTYNSIFVICSMPWSRRWVTNCWKVLMSACVPIRSNSDACLSFTFTLENKSVNSFFDRLTLLAYWIFIFLSSISVPLMPA